MEIYIAKNSGFCFGVKRAIKIAFDSSEKYDKLYTLGPLIHNPQMVDKLKESNILTLNSCDNYLENYPVIIRSHGITQELQEKMISKNINLIDATCPKVKVAQKWVSKLDNEGYDIVIIGDENHPEVIGLMSYVKENRVVAVRNVEDISLMKAKNKVGVVVQTTFNRDVLKDIISELTLLVRELRVINTVCEATSIRQKSTLNLARKVDLMLVIGGKNSSNTKALFEISKPFTEVYHIEDKKELKKKWFKEKKIIGLTAGASTPDWIIIDIYNELIQSKNNSGKKIINVGNIPKI